MEVWASASHVAPHLDLCQVDGLMDKFNAACERLWYTEKSTFIQESQPNEVKADFNSTFQCLNSLLPESLKDVSLEVSSGRQIKTLLT